MLQNKEAAEALEAVVHEDDVNEYQRANIPMDGAAGFAFEEEEAPVLPEADAGNNAGQASREETRGEGELADVAMAGQHSGGPARRRIPTGPVETPEEVKKYMPPGPLRYISYDNVLHYRWKVDMKIKPDPPRVCSKSWSMTGLSERDALLHVLRWAWQVEHELTCTACP